METLPKAVSEALPEAIFLLTKNLKKLSVVPLIYVVFVKLRKGGKHKEELAFAANLRSCLPQGSLGCLSFKEESE